jgi:hypothetical protein
MDRQFFEQVGTGLKDAAYRGFGAIAGGPVDLATMVMRPLGYSTPDNQVVGGSEWFGQKMQDAGLVSSSRNPVAEFLASVAIPAAAMRAGPAMFAAEQRMAQNAMAPRTLDPQAGAIAWPGSPSKLYHGTAKEFDRFDRNLLGSNTSANDASVGFHFSDNVADADLYATMAAEKHGLPRGFVGAYDVDMKRPLVVGIDPSDGNAPEKLIQEFLENKIAAARYAKENGFDGLIYPYGTNVDSGYTAIAFDADQIKKMGK